MGNINIELPNELHKKMKMICALTSDTIEQFVNRALEKKMKNDREVKLK